LQDFNDTGLQKQQIGVHGALTLWITRGLHLCLLQIIVGLEWGLFRLFWLFWLLCLLSSSWNGNFWFSFFLLSISWGWFGSLGGLSCWSRNGNFGNRDLFLLLFFGFIFFWWVHKFSGYFIQLAFNNILVPHFSGVFSYLGHFQSGYVKLWLLLFTSFLRGCFGRCFSTRR
jgi:hypothetical protein